jgi:hypothetical protein
MLSQDILETAKTSQLSCGTSGKKKRGIAREISPQGGA